MSAVRAPVICLRFRGLLRIVHRRCSPVALRIIDRTTPTMSQLPDVLISLSAGDEVQAARHDTPDAVVPQAGSCSRFSAIHSWRCNGCMCSARAGCCFDRSGRSGGFASACSAAQLFARQCGDCSAGHRCCVILAATPITWGHTVAACQRFRRHVGPIRS